MFTDDINLFYSHKDIKTLFHTANTELVKLSHWFKANKLMIKSKKSYLLNEFAMNNIRIIIKTTFLKK